MKKTFINWKIRWKTAIPSNLIQLGNYEALCPDARYFYKIDETEAGVGGEIQLTDALSKLDVIYGNSFESKTYELVIVLNG